ncbi:unnamed protein product [Closterium sp. Naga37s-1]|nr:unnamed protein product [Closterium sp. Naga37s-1]
MALLHRPASLLHPLHQRASQAPPSRSVPSIRSSMPIGRPSRGVPGSMTRPARRRGGAVVRTSLWDAVQGSGSGEGGGQQWGLAVSGEEPLGYSDEEGEGIVPLTDDAEAFGPEALLLLGLTPDEIEKVRAALDEAEASFISLLSADESVADVTLWDAMERAAQPFPSMPAPSVASASQSQASDSSSQWPNNVGERVCIVSGLSGIEIMDLVEIISSLDIPPMVYAAMVPKSAARPVREVVEDLVADHRMLRLDACLAAMHTWLYRVNAVVTLSVFLLIGLSVLASLSERLHSSAPTVDLDLLDVEHFWRIPGGPFQGNDEAVLTLNITANLTSVFTWNTKQLFVFVTADFSTPKHPLNQVSLWDAIVEHKEDAALQFTREISEYSLMDQVSTNPHSRPGALVFELFPHQLLRCFPRSFSVPVSCRHSLFARALVSLTRTWQGNSLRGLPFNLTGYWNVMPIVGGLSITFHVANCLLRVCPFLASLTRTWQGNSLRGLPFNLTVYWNVMPIVGGLSMDCISFSGFTMPPNYRPFHLPRDPSRFGAQQHHMHDMHFEQDVEGHEDGDDGEGFESTLGPLPSHTRTPLHRSRCLARQSTLPPLPSPSRNPHCRARSVPSRITNSFPSPTRERRDRSRTLPSVAHAHYVPAANAHSLPSPTRTPSVTSAHAHSLLLATLKTFPSPMLTPFPSPTRNRSVAHSQSLPSPALAPFPSLTLTPFPSPSRNPYIAQSHPRSSHTTNSLSPHAAACAGHSLSISSRRPRALHPGAARRLPFRRPCSLPPAATVPSVAHAHSPPSPTPTPSRRVHSSPSRTLFPHPSPTLTARTSYTLTPFRRPRPPPSCRLRSFPYVSHAHSPSATHARSLQVAFGPIRRPPSLQCRHTRTHPPLDREGILRFRRIRVHLPIPHLSIPHIPIPHLPVPHLLIPHLPVPHLPIPHLPMPHLPVPHLTSLLYPSLTSPSLPSPSPPPHRLPSPSLTSPSLTSPSSHLPVPHLTIPLHPIPHLPMSHLPPHLPIPSSPRPSSPRPSSLRPSSPRPSSPHPHLPIPHLPIPLLPNPHLPIPHLPIPHLPIPHLPIPPHPIPPQPIPPQFRLTPFRLNPFRLNSASPHSEVPHSAPLALGKGVCGAGEGSVRRWGRECEAMGRGV